MKYFIGYDPRERVSFAVCRHSIRRFSRMSPVKAIILEDVRKAGLYKREHIRKDGQLFDVISDAPMSTEFAISRFLTPLLADYNGYAVFMDADQMFMSNPKPIIGKAISEQPGKAVYCVKHHHEPVNTVKMDDQLQTLYRRKNWSSFMVFDCQHPKNREIANIINLVPGRDLHSFCWLDDDDIGELPTSLNYLVGHSQLPGGELPVNIHWTDGTPELAGYENTDFSGEWREMLNDWVRVG